MQKELKIDGKRLTSIKDVHSFLSAELDFGPYYGHNFSALWDFLTTEVERPFKITIVNPKALKQNLGSNCDTLIALFKKLEVYDEQMTYKEKFRLIIEGDL